jgi:hypothetical protein
MADGYRTPVMADGLWLMAMENGQSIDHSH